MKTVPEEKQKIFAEVMQKMHDYLEHEKQKQVGA